MEKLLLYIVLNIVKMSSYFIWTDNKVLNHAQIAHFILMK